MGFIPSEDYESFVHSRFVAGIEVSWRSSNVSVDSLSPYLFTFFSVLPIDADKKQ